MLPAGVAGLLIPGSHPQDSSMPGITDSQPSNVSLLRLDATCQIGPGSCPREGSHVPSRYRAAALKHQSTLPMGPGCLSLAHSAQTQADGAHTTYNAGHHPGTPVSIPVSTYPQFHEQRRSTNSNEWVRCPISPPQLAEKRSQQMDEPDGAILHERISSMRETPDDVQQVKTAPIQKIYASSGSALQQPHRATWRQHHPSPTAAAPVSVMAPVQMHHSQDPGQDAAAAAAAAATAAVSPDEQTDAGMGNDVTNLVLPNRTKSVAHLADREGANPAVTFASGSGEARFLSNSRMPSATAAALTAQPGGMNRSPSAFPQRPVRELTIPAINIAKATSTRQVPDGALDRLPTMIPAATRDMKNIISAACCITQASSLANASGRPGIEISLQMPPDEQIQPRGHQRSGSCFDQQQVPGSSLQLARPAVQMQPHTPKASSLGHEEGSQQLALAAEMGHHLIQLASPQQHWQLLQGHGTMFCRPGIPNTYHAQEGSASPRQDASKHIAVDWSPGSPGPDVSPGEMSPIERELSSRHEHAQNMAAAAATEAIGQAAQLGQGIFYAKEALGAGLDLLHLPSPDSIKLEDSVAQARRKFLQARHFLLV